MMWKTLSFLGWMDHFRKSPTENHQGMVGSLTVNFFFLIIFWDRHIQQNII